jgi:hypothetical protein
MSVDDVPPAPVLPPEPPVGEPLHFTCPRCRLEVSDQVYGPCPSCRTTLRATMGGDARQVDDTEYVPKMNVTPNAVATKD